MRLRTYRTRAIIVVTALAFALLLVACGDGTDTVDDVTDIDASSVVVNGQDLALDSVQCEPQMEEDGPRMVARGPDPSDEAVDLRLSVRAIDEGGASVDVIRTDPDDIAWDGHTWEEVNLGPDQVGSDGCNSASASDLALERRADLGQDEDDDGDSEVTVDFDVAC